MPGRTDPSRGEDRISIRIEPDVGPATACLLVAALARRSGRGPVRLGLPGGDTPVPIYRRLAELVPGELYARLAVTLVDERHPEGSNGRLVEEAWFERAGRRPARFLPMAMSDSVERDLLAFRAAFETRFEGGLDVALLGVGPDGHVASLFPGHPALDETGCCAVVRDSPKPPPTRLTLTRPVLERTALVVVVASGAAKADVLARAYQGDEQLPLGTLRPRGEYVWVLDESAASGLPRVS